LIGWFLLSGAQSANSQVVLETMLKGVTVSQVMNRSPNTVPANISLQALIDTYLLPNGWRSAFVTQVDRLAGFITLRDIRHVPRDEWAATLVSFAMVPREKLHAVSPQQSLNEVLPLMANRDVNQLPVVEDDHLVGVLSREDLMRFLEITRGLGLENGAR
jgi:CBS domain-containing protein